MTDHVKVEVEAGVMTITLARPEKKNALSNAMYGVLADSLEAAEKDPAIRVVVFQADGDSFTAGNDLQDFAAQASGAFTGERHVGRFLKALAHATRPLVAAVQGQAVGVGTTMLLHCDLVYVSPDARLSTPFVNLALVPEAASSWLLPARVGHARAYAMFALGEAVDGATAVAWGLANGSAELGDLRARARAAADQLAKRPLGALTITKRLMRDAEKIAELMDAEGALFGERLKTAEAREAFMAFMERRPPDFTKVG
ncbi:enoyl-CoA hydratase [Caulobacter sp. SSI4214]|uniref:enoyl-CoA hydratase n=1 Tax=Caulobacter sp. SSI4214 TaxID=2575739 RepID=UPI001439682B|nr:enoyl-CoA hydratase [Caulobacter sp. SSI4214]